MKQGKEMESKTVLLLIGRSGSGKSYLERKLCQLYPTVFNRVVSFTTRAKRENEVDGVDYLFITTEKYRELKQKGSVIQEVRFAGNVYGSLYQSYTVPQPYLTLVCTPQIVSFLPFLQKLFPNYKIVTVYFNISDERIYRNMLKRGDDEQTITKRLEHDDIKEDFEKSSLTADYVVTDDVLDETLPEIFFNWIIDNQV